VAVKKTSAQNSLSANASKSVNKSQHTQSLGVGFGFGGMTGVAIYRQRRGSLAVSLSSAL